MSMMKKRMNWKERCLALFTALNDIGIDVDRMIKAVNALPLKPLTSQTYSSKMSDARATLTVGVSFLYRDLDVLKRACDKHKSISRVLSARVGRAHTDLKKVDMIIYKWDKNSYPHSACYNVIA